MKIPFNKSWIDSRVLENIEIAIEDQVQGDGIFTKECNVFLENYLKCKKVLITQSCTNALEMCAILLNIKSGDEIIMSSFTHVSTANAFVLRGGVPIFIDIKRDTLNIDHSKIKEKITSKTRAIVVTHYGGYPCDMDEIMNIAKKYKLIVVEDAAQAIGSSYNNKKLGTIGHLGVLSFHGTKNITCGEGGALLINDFSFVNRAIDIWSFGTNRNRTKGKYGWVDIGSSFMPSEITAAVLRINLNSIDLITKDRSSTWYIYYKMLKDLDLISIININYKSKINGHIFSVLLKKHNKNKVLKELNKRGVMACDHYIPLHMSEYGKKYFTFSMKETEYIYNKMIRLPIFYIMDKAQILYTVNTLKEVLNENNTYI